MKLRNQAKKPFGRNTHPLMLRKKPSEEKPSTDIENQTKKLQNQGGSPKPNEENRQEDVKPSEENHLINKTIRGNHQMMATTRDVNRQKMTKPRRSSKPSEDVNQIKKLQKEDKNLQVLVKQEKVAPKQEENNFQNTKKDH